MKFPRENESHKDTGSALIKDKQHLRSLMLEKRRLLTDEQVRQASEAIIDIIKNLPAFTQSKVILSYMPYGREVDLLPLNEWILSQGKDLCLPRVLNGTDMDAVEVKSLSQGIVKSRFGILEPEPGLIPADIGCIDLILVPGLAFDVHGNRLGHGKGYYDRFLATSSKSTYTLGIAYGFQFFDNIPFDQYDKKVKGIVTEAEFYRCVNQE